VVDGTNRFYVCTFRATTEVPSDLPPPVAVPLLPPVTPVEEPVWTAVPKRPPDDAALAVPTAPAVDHPAAPVVVVGAPAATADRLWTWNTGLAVALEGAAVVCWIVHLRLRHTTKVKKT